MWDIVLDLILLEIIDRSPKPVRIGCTVLGAVILIVAIVYLVLR